MNTTALPARVLLTPAQRAYQMLDAIERYPDNHDQMVFISHFRCGTVACGAGWICILNGDRADEYDRITTAGDGYRPHIFERAQNLLGVPDDHARSMFYAPNRQRLTEWVEVIFGPRPDDVPPPVIPAWVDLRTEATA